MKSHLKRQTSDVKRQTTILTNQRSPVINHHVFTKVKLIAFIILNSSFLVPNCIQAQMFWNQTCSFAGNSSSYVAVPNSSTLNITSSFSIQAWINPSNLIISSKGIVSKGGALGSSGLCCQTEYVRRISIITNGNTRLVSKASTALTTSKWTHVTVTYDASTLAFNIFINGSLDTTSLFLGATPPSNTDSLYIGISGGSTPFAGQLDEIRIWNKALNSTEAAQNYKTSLGANTGIYSGLIMSMTFQDDESLGTPFSLSDMIWNNNNGVNRGVTGCRCYKLTVMR